ncbi:MAG: Dabb family protein [Phototrophicaceae bacterium]
MIAHVVFIKLQDKATATEIKAQLESLPPQIPEIKHYEVGIDEVESSRSFDVCLYSQFDSYDTLKIYNDHPAHVEVLAFIRERVTTVHAVDYTL